MWRENPVLDRVRHGDGAGVPRLEAAAPRDQLRNAGAGGSGDDHVEDINRDAADRRYIVPRIDGQMRLNDPDDFDRISRFHNRYHNTNPQILRSFEEEGHPEDMVRRVLEIPVAARNGHVRETEQRNDARRRRRLGRRGVIRHPPGFGVPQAIGRPLLHYRHGTVGVDIVTNEPLSVPEHADNFHAGWNCHPLNLVLNIILITVMIYHVLLIAYWCSQLADTTVSNAFTRDMPYELHVWLSNNADSVDFSDFSNQLWHQQNLHYGRFAMRRRAFFQLKTTPFMLENNSFYLHAYVTLGGKMPWASNEKSWMAHSAHQLNKFQKVERIAAVDGDRNAPILSHWHPDLTINLLDDQTKWTKNNLSMTLRTNLQFSNDSLNYVPALTFSTRANYPEDYVVLANGIDTIDLNLTFMPLDLPTWLCSVDSAECETDQLHPHKYFVVNIILLWVLVAFLHQRLHNGKPPLHMTSRDLMWKTSESMRQHSIHAAIALLYMQHVQRIPMLHFIALIRLCTTLCKEHTVGKQQLNLASDNRLLNGLEYLAFTDRKPLSGHLLPVPYHYSECLQKRLGWIVYTMLILYFVHDLLNFGKEMNVFILGLEIAYGFVNAREWIMALPHLLANYQLKTVAYFTYTMLALKGLKRIAANLLAYSLETPSLYRLCCIWNDMLFFVFLLQHFLYPIDPTRFNEFGYNEVSTARVNSNSRREDLVANNPNSEDADVHND